MRKICVVNYKGGTGKTSTVVNLAHGLSLLGQQVLLIDLDPQGSAGYHLGIQANQSTYELLLGSDQPSECIVHARPNLDIICSNERLFPAEIKIAGMSRREFLLKDKLNTLGSYDFVLMDCAPSMNLLNQNALLYCDEIIVPVSMEYLALVGVKQLLKNLKMINRIFKKEIRLCKIVPTFYDKRNSKSEDVIKSLGRIFPSALSSPIRTCVDLSEAPGYRESIFEYAPHSHGADDYQRLTREVLEVG